MKLLQPTIDWVQKRIRHLKYKENVYFKVLESDYPSDSILSIELLKGPFKGIIYSYGKLSIDEDLGYRGAKASFVFYVTNQEMNPELRAHYGDDPKLAKIAGQILISILERAIRVQADKYFKENLDEEVGEDYIEEPVPQRTVPEKSSSVSKKRISSGKKRKNSPRRSSKVRSTIQSDTDI